MVHHPDPNWINDSDPDSDPDFAILLTNVVKNFFFTDMSID